MFGNNDFNGRLGNRFNGGFNRNRGLSDIFNTMQSDPEESFAYDLLKRLSLENNVPYPVEKPINNMAKQEFVDEMFIALRTYFDGKVTVTEKGILMIDLSGGKRFSILIESI